MCLFLFYAFMIETTSAALPTGVQPNLPLQNGFVFYPQIPLLKRWELIVTAMLFLTLFAGFGLLYVAIPLEINYSDPACPHFELSDSAAKERQKAPGEL